MLIRQENGGGGYHEEKGHERKAGRGSSNPTEHHSDSAQDQIVSWVRQCPGSGSVLGQEVSALGQAVPRIRK